MPNKMRIEAPTKIEAQGEAGRDGGVSTQGAAAGLGCKKVPCPLLADASQGPPEAGPGVRMTYNLTHLDGCRGKKQRQSNGLFRRREAERLDNSEVVMLGMGVDVDHSWRGRKNRGGKGCGLSGLGCDPIFWLGFAWVPGLR